MKSGKRHTKRAESYRLTNAAVSGFWYFVEYKEGVRKVPLIFRAYKKAGQRKIIIKHNLSVALLDELCEILVQVVPSDERKSIREDMALLYPNRMRDKKILLTAYAKSFIGLMETINKALLSEFYIPGFNEQVTEFKEKLMNRG